MDDLGNRTGSETQRNTTHTYAVDSLTNRYTAIDAAPIAHDTAGNLTQDRQGYVYFYDYENRIVRIENGVGNFVASFDYDALGHRIRKMAGTETTLYYNDPEWRVLAEYDAANNQLRKYVYGNYLDETLRMTDTYAGDGSPVGDYYFLQDHLYSPAVLLSSAGAVVERYEFDAYGTRHVFDQNFGTRANTNFGNYIAFQGHIHDRLDNGNLNLLDARYRTYDPFAGRWLMHEKLGMMPNGQGQINPFMPTIQFSAGSSLYLGLSGNPLMWFDPYGLWHYDISNPIERSKWRRTLVIPDEGETLFDIDSLALFLRLDPDEFDKWARFQHQNGKCGYNVPNTAYIDIGSYSWGALGHFLMGYDSNLQEKWKSEGLFVLHTGQRETSVQTIESHLHAKDILKYAFIGHGSEGSLTGLLDESLERYGRIFYIDAQRYTYYGIAEMHLIACETNAEREEWEKNISPYGFLRTIDGILTYIRAMNGDAFVDD